MAEYLPIGPSVIDDDFKAILTHLTTFDAIPRVPSSSMVSSAKRVHTLTYTLLVWKFRLSNLPTSAIPFIEEIASDAIQFLPQFMMGYTRATKLLLRGIVENALRFIYFKDHPVEFARMNAEKKWYLSVTDLFDYTKSHPNFKLSEPKFDAVNRLKTIYDTLSSSLHGRTVLDFELRSSLIALRFEASSAAVEMQLLRQCVEATNFILIIENRSQFRHFPPQERSLILRSMSSTARSTVHHFCGAIGED